MEIYRSRDRAERVTDDRIAIRERVEAVTGESRAALSAGGSGCERPDERPDRTAAASAPRSRPWNGHACRPEPTAVSGRSGARSGYQRICIRSISSCSGGLSSAGSRRVPSKLRLASGATCQRRPVRQDRSSAMPSPA